jgi:hypothetical protein
MQLEVLLSPASETAIQRLYKLSRIKSIGYHVLGSLFVIDIWPLIPVRPDVYNMQLSNEPAEELAKVLVNSANGAFELCGFVSGGNYLHIVATFVNPHPLRLLRFGGDGGSHQAC